MGEQREYGALKHDGPSFPAAIYAIPARTEGDENLRSLI
jgi:hypothetical protein